MKLSGTSVSRGFAVGKVFIYKTFQPVIEKTTLHTSQIEDALLQFRAAKKAAAKELDALATISGPESGHSKIFKAHLEIASDPAISEDVEKVIVDDYMAVGWAVHSIYDKYISLFENVEDTLIRERASDLRDVRDRILRCLKGENDRKPHLPDEPIVLLAHDLMPSDTAQLDPNMILAIITESGGTTSHTAIIARAHGIPAVLGVKDVLAKVADGSVVAVDAIDGCVVIDPDRQLEKQYNEKRAAFVEYQKELAAYWGKPAVLADGTAVQTMLNIAHGDETELQAADHVDGVGLFRTEFLYMDARAAPSEEEQLTAYRRVLETFGDKPVILRTLDIGGDKQLAYMDLPKEDNPFLGLRALRLCFSLTDLFRTQLRAALRAAPYGNLWVMFPMVGDLEDFHRAKAIAQEVEQSLASEGIDVLGKAKYGIMIEIPSIALVADQVANAVDFASIGTNDLCQYLTATDRLNPGVSEYYQERHPAMLRLIKNTIDAFDKAGKPISVCGEMAGDPVSAVVLAGLGLRKFSMGSAGIAQVRQKLSTITLEKAEALAGKLLRLPSTKQVEDTLKKELSVGQIQ